MVSKAEMFTNVKKLEISSSFSTTFPKLHVKYELLDVLMSEHGLKSSIYFLA